MSIIDSLFSPDDELLRGIVNKYRPDLEKYEEFYRQVHHDPELSGMEENTAWLVAGHLTGLGFEVRTGIGGHGVAAVLRNGKGKTILMRAELDALPILEQTDLPYKSTKRMVDRYGNERPVMHAGGHDMNMAALLGASELLVAAAKEWSGTLLVVFQPDAEETGGAQAMVDDGLYSKRIPRPDIMLAQHVKYTCSGTVGISSGEIMVATDSVNVRVTGGPCPGVNPQQCVDAISVALQIITQLPDDVCKEVGTIHNVVVVCKSIHAGVPGNDYVAHADFRLDIMTFDHFLRGKAHEVIRRKIQDCCKAARTPVEPVINFTVRAPPTTNDAIVAEPIRRVFKGYFQDDAWGLYFTPGCEDFPLLGGLDACSAVPYAYWIFGGTQWGTEGPQPENRSPFFAPAIQPTLRAGTDAMALAVLTFLTANSRCDAGRSCSPEWSFIQVDSSDGARMQLKRKRSGFGEE